MTSQEILSSLSQLEKELESISSARLLAEKTITAYQEVQSEIKVFFKEFQNVIGTLNTITQALDSERTVLTSEVKATISSLENQINEVNKTFTDKCNAAILDLASKSHEAADSFKSKIDSITSDFKVNNETFKQRISELASVQTSLTNAINSVSSLKTDIAKLESQLSASQKQQDATLDSIATELKATGAKHGDILSKLSDDLKASQDAQDKDLADLKRAHDNHSGKINSVLDKEDKLISGISSLEKSVSDKSVEANGRIDNIEKSSKTTNILIIINLIISLFVLLFEILK
ncbi:MAG: hypothetical protein HDT08_06030 [Bacteroidales bacterium]|nr:hypothetical protein [Bacteroidales bacterium]